MQHGSGKISLIGVIFTLSFILALGLALYFSAPEKSLINESVIPVKSDQVEALIQTEEKPEAPLVVESKPKSEPSRTRIISNNTRSNASPASKQKNNPAQRNKQSEKQAWLEQAYTRLHVQKNTNTTDAQSPSIAGRVLSPDGKPIRAVVVRAQKRNYFSTQASDTNTPADLTSTTNAAGFFAFKDLADGIYLLSTNTNKRFLPKRIEVRTGVQYADLVLTEMENIELQGRVVDKTSKQPIMDVTITPLTQGVPAADTSNNLGQFTLEVAIGERTNIPLRLQKDGYKQARFNVNAYAFETHQNLEIEMEKSAAFGHLFGQVTGEDQGFMHKIMVQLYSPKLRTNYKAETNSAGEYNFTEVEMANDYRLWVRPSSNYKDFSMNNINVGRDVVRQDITLEALEQGFELSGRVMDMENKAVANTTLIVRSMKARNQIIPVTTDDYGNFSAENVPEGELTIGTNSAPHYTLSGIRLGGSNRSAYHELVVDRGDEKLIGKIVDEEGDPVSAPQIYLTSLQLVNGLKSQSSRNTSADSEGKFLFTDLGSKRYTITVNAPGFKGKRVQHNISSNNQVTIHLVKEAT